MTCTPDLTIEAMVRDPVIAAVRRADRVEAAAFETMLRAAQRRLAEAERRSTLARALAGGGRVPSRAVMLG